MKNPTLNTAQFEFAMKIIFATFGRDEYPPERTKLIYDDVKDLTEFEFRRIVKHFCKTRSVKYPPLPTHFHEESQNQRKARYEKAVDEVLASDDPRDRKALERVLGAMGAHSLLEAVMKSSERNHKA